MHAVVIVIAIADETHPHPNRLADRVRASMREPFRRRIACDPKPRLHPIEGEGTWLKPLQPSKKLTIPEPGILWF